MNTKLVVAAIRDIQEKLSIPNSPHFDLVVEKIFSKISKGKKINYSKLEKYFTKFIMANRKRTKAVFMFYNGLTTEEIADKLLIKKFVVEKWLQGLQNTNNYYHRIVSLYKQGCPLPKLEKQFNITKLEILQIIKTFQ